MCVKIILKELPNRAPIIEATAVVRAKLCVRSHHAAEVAECIQISLKNLLYRKTTISRFFYFASISLGVSSINS